jgi:hypothetical protein
MKSNFLKTILMAILPICAVSCIDNVPEVEVLPTDAISFEYYIDHNAEPKYYLDFYVDSEITFVNTSPTAGDAEWDFDGDGATDAVGNTVNYAFSKAGTHKVQLSIGDLKLQQVVMIAPIKPLVTIKYPADASICEVRNTPITFEVELPNPKSKEAIFKWTFPTDTKYGDGTDATTFEAKYFTTPADSIIPLPEALKFWHVGSQEVKLEVTLGGEPLEVVVKNVPVAYDKEVPTLYYAVQGGRIMAYKLTNGLQPEDMNIAPFDLGVSSGQHPFNLLFQDSLLYVLDAGKQFYYVNDVNGVLGDGKISVISKDGAKVQTMISNVGQAAFDDPFYGFIEGSNLYYANRNTGIIKVPLKDRDKMYSTSEYPYYINHNTLGYYNNGIAYGAIGGVFGKIKGVWHWCKFYNANGIFRFEDGDILPAAIAQGDDSNVPQAGVMLSSMKPRSFVYTSKSATPKMCVCLKDADANGFFAATYEEMDAVGSSKNALKAYEKKYNGMSFSANLTGNLPAVEGHGDETVGICQMAYDEANDCVYFGFRNNSAQKDLYPATGIYRYNVATDQIDCLIEGPSVYGLVVNNTPAKLF